MPEKQVFPNEDFQKLGLEIIKELEGEANLNISNPQLTKVEIDYDNERLGDDGETKLVNVTVTFSSNAISFTVEKDKKNPPIGSV
jgi:hypothetical protein